MRWIDIILPEPGTHRQMDSLLSAAVAQMARIPEIQTRDGLDAVTMLEVFAGVGRLLFQAVQAVDPEAFSPERHPATAQTPPLGEVDHDGLRGYHVVVDPTLQDLPWHWLHNSVGFLLAKHPICVATHGSRLPDEATRRPWMERCLRAGFMVADDGSPELPGIMPQLRPADTSPPRMLFVPGHSDRRLRRLIYREAEAIQGALEIGFHGGILARMDVEPEPITPSDLCERGFMYQALHFAGPTSLPAATDDSKGEYWINQLIEDATAPRDHALEERIGLEGEVLGVDPVTSLLDDIIERYETQGPPVEVGSEARVTNVADGDHSLPNRPYAGRAPRSWLLDDGPVEPEHIGRSGLLPPLIFSNSFCALPELGRRFTRAGASAFVGPVVPLFSRPARIFAGYFYHALGSGWDVGAAAWRAARDCRVEFGSEHPAWLSYGVHGYGTLALPYL